jgi:hypothetical protein
VIQLQRYQKLDPHPAARRRCAKINATLRIVKNSSGSPPVGADLL